MYENSVSRKLYEFAIEFISIEKFKDMLRDSSSSQRMRITRVTEGSSFGGGENPHKAEYWMYWDGSAYVGGSAGGSDTKEEQHQYNLQGEYGSGDWRTLSYDNIKLIRFKNKLYKIR